MSKQITIEDKAREYADSLSLMQLSANNSAGMIRNASEMSYKVGASLAIQFAEWKDNNCRQDKRTKLWVLNSDCNPMQSLHTNEQLFTIFLNQQQ